MEDVDRLKQQIAELEQKVSEQDQVIASHKRLENQVTQLHVLTAELKQSSQRLVKARDQAVEASKFKSQFLANMSHEIRTPMNALIGVSDLLMRTNLSRDQKEYAEMIRDSAANLLEIVNDILDFSKVEAGKVQLELCDLDLVQVVEGAAELLAEKAHQKNLALMTFIDPQIERSLRGDPTRLRQIILNLVSNAIKFTETGEVFIHAMPLRQENADFVKIVVKDSGIGIAKDVQTQIFSPFTQADNSVTRKYGGTGLGLSICRKLIELMGGEIHLESVEGRGTTIWFTFPLELANDKVIVEIPPKLNEIRMLLVDGPTSATRIIQAYARTWNIKCDTAETGAIARTLMESAFTRGMPYHLVLVQSHLPDMTADDFGEKVAVTKYADETKIVLFNPSGPPGAPKSFHNFSGYLTAPMRQSLLMDCLNRIATVSDVAPMRATQSNVPVARSNSGCRILIAEDNQVNQRVAVLQLQQIGFTADVVSNGEEALVALKKLPYDLVLMDCQMPVMDGFEATREIRKAEVQTGRRIPIVAMTAHAMDGDREKCIAEGMDDYVSKPVSPDKLRTILERWLQIEPATAASAAKVEEDAVIPRRSWNPENEPPLDIDKLQELCSDDDSVPQMINMFMTSAERLLKNLNNAIQDHDPIKIRSVSYEITGASDSVGADELTGIGECLQRVALEKNWTQCKILFEAYRQALEVITDYSEKHQTIAQGSDGIYSSSKS